MIKLNSKRNIFNIIFIFIFHNLLINCEKECSEYKDCFNCTICGNEYSDFCNCYWKSNGGVNLCVEDDYRPLDKWYTELSQCSNNHLQEIYCSGENNIYTKDDLNKEDYSITFQILSDDEGKYGKNNLFCYFNYIDENLNDYQLNIEFSNSIENKPRVAYGCTFNENGQEKIQQIDEDKTITCSRSNSIFFMALLKDEYPSSPVFFKITLNNTSANKIVTVFSIALMLLLLIACMICCITRFYNNKARRQLRLLMNQRAHENMMRIEQENNNADYFNESENIEENNRIKLDELFSTKMVEHTYKNEYNKYGGGCSICLEEFKKKSKVSKTPCNHVFHYKCIKDWLYKNAKNPKCPNCNKEVLANDEVDINEKIDETNIIKVKKKQQQNNNNNILNNNLNFARRNSNNINPTINMNRQVNNNFNTGGRGDFSQSQRQQLGEY